MRRLPKMLSHGLAVDAVLDRLHPSDPLRYSGSEEGRERSATIAGVGWNERSQLLFTAGVIFLTLATAAAFVIAQTPSTCQHWSFAFSFLALAMYLSIVAVALNVWWRCGLSGLIEALSPPPSDIRARNNAKVFERPTTVVDWVRILTAIRCFTATIPLRIRLLLDLRPVPLDLISRYDREIDRAITVLHSYGSDHPVIELDDEDGEIVYQLIQQMRGHFLPRIISRADLVVDVAQIGLYVLSGMMILGCTLFTGYYR